MPQIKSAWLLPTDETLYLGNMSHSEVIIKFISGLKKQDVILTNYCLQRWKQFRSQERYTNVELRDAIEDYAILCLRWIKIGNAYNYNNNATVTIADYDGNAHKIAYYQNISYQVNIIPISVHYYELLGQRDYDKMNVAEIIASGSCDENLLK